MGYSAAFVDINKDGWDDSVSNYITFSYDTHRPRYLPSGDRLLWSQKVFLNLIGSI